MRCPCSIAMVIAALALCTSTCARTPQAQQPTADGSSVTRSAPAASSGDAQRIHIPGLPPPPAAASGPQRPSTPIPQAPAVAAERLRSQVLALLRGLQRVDDASPERVQAQVQARFGYDGSLRRSILLGRTDEGWHYAWTIDADAPGWTVGLQLLDGVELDHGEAEGCTFALDTFAAALAASGFVPVQAATSGDLQPLAYRKQSSDRQAVFELNVQPYVARLSQSRWQSCVRELSLSSAPHERPTR